MATRSNVHRTRPLWRPKHLRGLAAPAPRSQAIGASVCHYNRGVKNTTFAILALQALLPLVLRAQIGNISVLDAVGFHQGLPPAGWIGTIFCTGLTVQGLVNAPGGPPFPTSLAGVSVTIGGVAAPILAVANWGGGYQQINFQVPYGFANTTVVVSQGSIQGSATATVSSLGNFLVTPGTLFGIFQHASDYSLVTVDNPASAGELVVGYATGLWPVYPAVPEGQLAPLSPLSSVPPPPPDSPQKVDDIGLLINNTSLPYTDSSLPPILFMGLAPGYVGLYQVDFVVPGGLPSGNAAIGFWSVSCMATPFDDCFARDLTPGCRARRSPSSPLNSSRRLIAPQQVELLFFNKR